MALRSVTVKLSAGDYSSASAMFAGEVGDLTAAGLNRQLEVACSAIVGDGFASAGAGWTTDATHTVLMYAVDNHNGIFGGIGGTSAYSGFLQYNIDFATLRGISSLLLSSTNTSVVFDRCIGDASTGFGSIAVSMGASGLAVNCVAIGVNNAQLGFSAPSGGTCYNCTAYGASTGYSASGGAMVVKNCAAVSCAIAGFSPSTTWTGSSNCASTDASVPTSGSGHRANQTITFYNAAAGDYRLKWTDTGAKGYGVDLSADPTFPFSVDITGATRTVPWDIGDSVAMAAPLSDVVLGSVPTDTNPNDVRLAALGTIPAAISVTGVEGTGDVGTVTATGAALDAVSGVAATGAVGTTTTTGAALTTPSGVAATGAIGSATTTGAANVSVTGVSATGAIGTATESGGATIGATGVSATGSVGTATEFGSALVAPSGVSATGAVGTVTLSGDASLTVSGVGASSAIGTVVASGAALVAPSGVSATGDIGSVDAIGAADIDVVGVEAIGSVGTVVATGGHGVVETPSETPPERIVGTTSDLPGGIIGLYRAYDPADDEPFVIRIAAEARPMGVHARGAVGQVVATGGASASPDGAESHAAMGRVLAFGAKNLPDDELIAILMAA